MAGDLLPKLSLPFPTIFLASPAKTDGGFGLVTVPLTIPYHPLNLGRTLPREAITNHYHRTGGDGGQGDDLGAGEVVRWCGTMARVM